MYRNCECARTRRYGSCCSTRVSRVPHLAGANALFPTRPRINIYNTYVRVVRCDAALHELYVNLAQRVGWSVYSNLSNRIIASPSPPPPRRFLSLLSSILERLDYISFFDIDLQLYFVGTIIIIHISVLWTCDTQFHFKNMFRIIAVVVYSIREDTKFEHDISYVRIAPRKCLDDVSTFYRTYSAAKTYLHVYYAVCAVCEGNEVIARKPLRQRRKY